MRDIKFRAWSKSDNKYYYRVLVGNTDNVELRKKIEVIGNIHENPELLEEK